ncbi:MAG: urea amidolyase [Rhodobacteraceae bacterium]|nr:urea amidolyase [Paracoccaceae bacterium]
MTRNLIIHRAGPGLTVQDQGRPGRLDRGLSIGGAADQLALVKGAALLCQRAELAALEMAGMGGEFGATAPTRFALTGAPMRASLDGEALVWNASHMIQPGQRLNIGPATRGVYGYLHLGGGIDGPASLGARSAHLTAGIGALIADGDRLPLAEDRGTRAGLVLDVEDRFSGGILRIVPSIQTENFSKADRQRFAGTVFTRDPRGNRMGVRLTFQGDPFQAEDHLGIVSEIIVPGDIQITGDGDPFILLGECQTTGGYPRIATVIPPDLPRVAQAPPGAMFRFEFVTRREGFAAMQRDADARRALASRVAPLIRDPRDMADLLSYDLISGVTDGKAEQQ